MKGDIRRQGILKCLSEVDVPVSANVLSQKFGVSRQIIVKDIARLRDSGFKIISYARGYALEKKGTSERVFKIFHSDEDVEKELTLIVDLGGSIRDVFVYHKFYDKVRAKMDIKSRLDIKNFLEDLSTGKSSLLKNVTSGYHYHTVSADTPETLDLIEEKLKENGFLAPLQEYEPTEIMR